MPEFTSPLWLTGLAALPVIWWLHRLQRHDIALPVSALFLWRSPAAAASAGNIPRHSDPRWFLRALLFSTLLLVLAGPRLPGAASAPLVIWFDHSLSMQTQTDGGTRASLAVDNLLATLRQRDAATHIVVRSLANPAAAIDLPAARPLEWHRQLTDWLGTQGAAAPRVPAVLPPGSEYWLVTDGADRTINAWLENVPVSRVITVGSRVDNAALTRLSLRRSLESPQRLAGMLTLHHSGDSAMQRRLEIHADGQLLSEATVQPGPGIAVHHDFTVPAGHQSVTARLIPADALPADDRLTIGLDDFGRIPVITRGNCGRGLQAALDAHPGLDVQHRDTANPPGMALLVVDCNGAAVTTNHPSLVIHRAPAYRPVGGVAYWHAESGGLQQLELDRQWLSVTGSAVAADNTIPLLSAGGTPLITARALPGSIDIYLDLSFPALVHRPEFPLLVSGLADLALGRNLLDPDVSVSRDPGESAIRPLLQWNPAMATRPPSLSGGHIELAPRLLVIALLLLLTDILVLPGTRTAPSRST